MCKEYSGDYSEIRGHTDELPVQVYSGTVHDLVRPSELKHPAETMDSPLKN